MGCERILNRPKTWTAVATLLVLGCSETQRPVFEETPDGTITTTVEASFFQGTYNSNLTIRLEILNEGPDQTLDFMCGHNIGYEVTLTDGTPVIEFPDACGSDASKWVIESNTLNATTWQVSVAFRNADYVIEAGILEHRDRFAWGSDTVRVSTN